MGLALASGFSRVVGGGRVHAAGRSPAGVARLREAVPGATVLPLGELPDRADLILLCVPNGDLSDVVDELRPRLTDRHLVVTVNNGLPLRALADAVRVPVAKLIPNAGNEAGAGATLLVPGPGLAGEDVEDLLGLLGGFSTPFLIEEEQGRAATDLSSCGPALLAAAVKAMVHAQRERGAPLTEETAELLATQSLHALSRLLGEGARLDDVIDRVAVPGGNTAAGIEASWTGLTSAWEAAFAATADNERSKAVPRLVPRAG